MVSLFNKLKNMRVLLIDDDELIRDSLSLVFTKKGCVFTTVETAEKGLRALDRESFDIIISDYRLPGIDGLEFFKLAAARQPDTIKILISAYASEDIISAARGIGVHDFIEKPFSPGTIIKSVSRLIQQHEKAE